LPDRNVIQLSASSTWIRRWDISLRHRAGALDLDLNFPVERGWTALFAPSGAGKTTALRLIAGLDRPQAGRIVHLEHTRPLPACETVLLDTDTRVNVPARDRRIRMVAQRSALFPHLSVERNIRYSKLVFEQDDVDPEAVAHQYRKLLRICRVAHLLDKMPHQLSGGERQRVALARAFHFYGHIRLMLLDEPFTGLEASLRDDIILELRAWMPLLPVLLVTHDLGEVFAANAHVLKMESGRIVAQGSAADVLAPERDRLLQRLAGG